MHQATLAGQSVNQTDRDFTPALVIAAQGGFTTPCNIPRHGAKADARARDGTTALSMWLFPVAVILPSCCCVQAPIRLAGCQQDALILIATRARNTRS